MTTMIIEIPRGDRQRRHWNSKLQDFEDTGALADFIPVNDGICPGNYGFIEGTKTAGDGEAADCLLVSEQSYTVGSQVEVRPIAILYRENNDNKVIVVEVDDPRRFADLPEEQQSLLINFLTYKSPLTAIGDEKEAQRFLTENAA